MGEKKRRCCSVVADGADVQMLDKRLVVWVGVAQHPM
jgi:hypothetical protein